jgi:hypothetical protein
MVTIEFGNPTIKFDFCRNKVKQKIWIDAILRYGNLDLYTLAILVDIQLATLQKVHSGNIFLSDNETLRLAELFLLTFCD